MLYIISIALSPLLSCTFFYFLLYEDIKNDDFNIKEDAGDLFVGLIFVAVIISVILCTIVGITQGILLSNTDPIDTEFKELPILISINSDNYVSVIDNNLIKQVKISNVYTTDRIDDYVIRATYIYPDWAKKIFFDNKKIEYNYYYSPD